MMYMRLSLSLNNYIPTIAISETKSVNSYKFYETEDSSFKHIEETGH